jgi:putative membrane protein insertion efficiency factor
MRRSKYRDDLYYRPRSRRGGAGGGCMRDACLLETGCCVAEALDGNCLIAGLMLIPTMLATVTRPAPRGSRERRSVAVIRLYQRNVSAKRDHGVCRFSPSCSEYAAQAITAHGTVRGTRMAARRLLRCRPGAARGADPVPMAA